MNRIHIGILGGGPAGLFMLKRLVEKLNGSLAITILERNSQLGAGMPYSRDGANLEHITNISDHEIPELETTLHEWIRDTPAEILKPFGINPENFNQDKVVPRLLLGQFLAAQFDLFIRKAKHAGIPVKVFCKVNITDIAQATGSAQVTVHTADGKDFLFDHVIICTGHNWPKKHEGQVSNWFDSPYPPSKLPRQCNYPVGIKGASLTAIDAVRTLARTNGSFAENEKGEVTFKRLDSSPDFRIVLHSLSGLLPAIRFHLEHAQSDPEVVPNEEELRAVMAANDGFMPLDYLFQRNFMDPLRREQPEFYERVKHMNLEAFVAAMMDMRERVDPFVLFRAEYAEAEKSIRRKKSIYWKEMLGELSFALNYPAKHLSAEDMIRLRGVLMPLISIVIAMLPQAACKELLALHDAGVLSVIAVDKNSKITPAAEGGIYSYTDENGQRQEAHYPLFIDGVGQPPIPFEDFPFQSLCRDGIVSRAYLRFRSKEYGASSMSDKKKTIIKNGDGEYYLCVPGININDHFQVLDKYGAANDRIYIMAVPYISGLNPDYSGLDFCEAASARIAANLKKYFEAIPAS